MIESELPQSMEVEEDWKPKQRAAFDYRYLTPSHCQLSSQIVVEAC